MLKRRNRTCTALIAILTLNLAASADWADEQPLRYNPRSLDGALTTLVLPVDGNIWSAWAYRNGAEYDIAISFKEPSGFWSEPTFIGRGDRVDQVQPTLTADHNGTLYLAYTDRAGGAVMLTALLPGSERWLDAAPVTDPGQRGFMPALHVVGDRLVVAFRSGNGLVIRDFPLLSPELVITGHTIDDSFDPFDNRPASGGERKRKGGGSTGGNDDSADGEGEGSDSSTAGTFGRGSNN